MPAIQVAPNQGKMLALLARMAGARRILEIGTLGGYSTLWLARGLPSDGSGRIVTLEFEPRHAEVARANFARAGLSAVVEVRVGPALETLPTLAAEGGPAFDLIFIDADKDNYPGYLEWALRLARPGGVIVADNIVRQGRVADPACDDARVQGAQRFLEMLAGGRARRASDGHGGADRRQQGLRRVRAGGGGRLGALAAKTLQRRRPPRLQRLPDQHPARADACEHADERHAGLRVDL